MEINNPDGSRVTFQPTQYGTISGLETDNFKLENDRVFFINNEGEEDLFLNVKYAGATEFQSRKFREGYNENPVVEIEADAELTEGSYYLSWGV
jgi:methionine-rich copper-binding protein CopC